MDLGETIVSLLVRLRVEITNPMNNSIDASVSLLVRLRVEMLKLLYPIIRDISQPPREAAS